MKPDTGNPDTFSSSLMNGVLYLNYHGKYSGVFLKEYPFRTINKYQIYLHYDYWDEPLTLNLEQILKWLKLNRPDVLNNILKEY
jgi:hypothetical protein